MMVIKILNRNTAKMHFPSMLLEILEMNRQLWRDDPTTTSGTHHTPILYIKCFERTREYIENTIILYLTIFYII